MSQGVVEQASKRKHVAFKDSACSDRDVVKHFNVAHDAVMQCRTAFVWNLCCGQAQAVVGSTRIGLS